NEDKLRAVGILSSAHPVFELGRPKGFIITSGTAAIIPCLASILDSTGALVVLDGLDEVTPELRAVTERAIISLASKLRTVAIIVTCRSGDYVRPLDGFDSLEIAPLTDEQICAIAERWCD